MEKFQIFLNDEDKKKGHGVYLSENNYIKILKIVNGRNNKLFNLLFENYEHLLKTKLVKEDIIKND